MLTLTRCWLAMLVKIFVNYLPRLVKVIVDEL